MKLLLFDQNTSPRLIERITDLFPGSMHVFVRGFPPKIIWIRRGNCSTQAIESILRENYGAIETLSNDEKTGILTLF
jgi:predicted nuclease of predicted toxin-antitoxin system